jgi:hypothetical protein
MGKDDSDTDSYQQFMLMILQWRCMNYLMFLTKGTKNVDIKFNVH